jgi:hypothetical protein
MNVKRVSAFFYQFFSNRAKNQKKTAKIEKKGPFSLKTAKKFAQ